MALLKYFGVGRMWFNTPPSKDGEKPSEPEKKDATDHNGK